MHIIATVGNAALQIPSHILSAAQEALSSLIARIEKVLQKTTPEERFSLPVDYAWGAEMVVQGERLAFITSVQA